MIRRRTPSPRHWVLFAVTALTAAACLPNRLSQSELDERAAAGSEADSAISGADTASSGDSQAETGASGCGNGTVDGKEECDFSGANWCSGCDQCKLRTTWKVDSNDALVTPVNTVAMAAALADAASGFSVEFWFKASQLPVGSDSVGMAAVAGKLPGSPAFVVALARDSLKNASYVTCGYVPKQSDPASGVFLQGNEAVKLGEWNHVRCAWSAGDQAMKLSQNGSEPALIKVQTKPTMLFEAGSSFAVGALSLATGKPGFRGELDELRVLIGANAANFKTFQARYSGGGLGLAMLLHMDEVAGATRLSDSSPSGLHMRQSSKQPLGYDFEKVPLVFLPETCYGYSLAQISCAPAAQPKAPFCL